jgi:hypothetical protein
MRRLLFIAAAGVLFASCSKEYKCRCVSTVIGSGARDTTEFSMAVSRKNDANTKCQQYQNQYKAQFGSGAGVTKDFNCTVQ